MRQITTKKTSKIADAEWKIMLLLWETAPMTCRQIEDALKQETGWSRHTIISFLNRMKEKNVVRMEEAKPSRLYYPLLDKRKAMLSEAKSFAKKLFHGNAGLMVSSLVDSGEISQEDITAIMNALKEAQRMEIEQDD